MELSCPTKLCVVTQEFICLENELHGKILVLVTPDVKKRRKKSRVGKMIQQTERLDAKSLDTRYLTI